MLFNLQFREKIIVLVSDLGIFADKINLSAVTRRVLPLINWDELNDLQASIACISPCCINLRPWEDFLSPSVMIPVPRSSARRALGGEYLELSDHST